MYNSNNKYISTSKIDEVGAVYDAKSGAEQHIRYPAVWRTLHKEARDGRTNTVDSMIWT